MIFEGNYTVAVILKNYTLPVSELRVVFISKSLQSSFILMVTLADWGSMTMAFGNSRKLKQVEKGANMIINGFMLKRQ